MSASLYIVPTPIGNLGDITYRAVEVLKAVDFILAEDTRTSSVLLRHYNISKPLSSFHAHNEHKRVANLVERMKAGEVAALISDAGMPGISDPGFLLVRECLNNNVQIDCLPGASAILPALIKSGFPPDKFVFEGFLPHKKGRKTRIEGLAEEARTIVLYESPHRLLKLLGELSELLGPERRVSVSRELTKLHEETYTGEVSVVLTYFEEKGVKGEIVIVIEGCKQKRK
ncbi:MAG: 16S rRNA (cytidine(1402)-2'-O)-methyltransferase [Cyclobacteriaceae bacterium]|nr:16S rRNA (cytidine(1402)-2'-O)-methyltransferase [Cyclobacteriaceae bacterium]